MHALGYRSSLCSLLTVKSCRTRLVFMGIHGLSCTCLALKFLNLHTCFLVIVSFGADRSRYEWVYVDTRIAK